ncbi:hypothetical protein GH714_037495 [Hevea brasiliensis]|uniref:Amino acid transporter transmembrane domain-containing protein n=1 Tax=Hevea brasiliensis TaxID=3981 RepID=A0A6A6L4M1_HEVBR|nr:hypothetical protein GH714_037495 [Hevea brasiliensis]
MSPTIGVDVPLLPEHKVTEKRAASVSGAVFNVSTSIIVLDEIHNSGESKTYAGVMREAFGPVGSVAVQICVMITNLGCLIIYLIIIGDVLSGNVHEGRVESLRFSSAISVLLAVVFVGISSVLAISALIEGKTNSPRLLPHLDNQVSFFDLFTAVPVIVTAFTFHSNVHPIGFELGKPSDMISAVRISLVICAVIYFSIGIFGYLLFGESIMADILVNFDRSSDTASGALLNDMVRLSYALHLMLVFPLLNFSLRANIDEFLFPRKTLLAKDTTRFVSLTLIILIFTYLLAIAIPNIWYFFQFVGSTFAVCLAFIFPGAIVLRDTHRISTTKDRIIASTMIILAVVTSTIAISTNIYSMT